MRRQALWTAAEAAEATGGLATAPWSVGGVAIDTRSIATGDLFVALQGDARDGHVFAPDAIAKGAGAVMISREVEALERDAPRLIVDDTMAALARLALAARRRAVDCAVIAVTGSVGKTGVKEMLRTMLSPQALTHAAEKSYNNHWGAPLTLARMPRDTRYGVIELGMNHAGEISPLAQLAQPHVALITTVEAVHLAAFGSVEEIADAKAEIFDGLAPGGVAILNRDNSQYDRLAAAARARGADRIMSFGRNPRAEYRLMDVGVAPAMTTVSAEIRGRPVNFRISAPGAHLAMNALGALAAAEAAGADADAAAAALINWRPPAGRGERWRVALAEGDSFALIDESYNANPASLRAALEAFATAAPRHPAGRLAGRRIAFLTDMLELGPTEGVLHAEIAALPAMDRVDLVYAAGPRMKSLFDALPVDRRGGWAEDADALADQVGRIIRPGDVAMVKGSLGSRASVIAAALKRLGEAIADDNATA